MQKILLIKWTESRARETYGWNICTLVDGSKKFRTCGGGYDMVGTVFADWLWHNHAEEIKALLAPYETNEDIREAGFYGFSRWGTGCGLDGGCGLDSMLKIARAIGLEVNQMFSQRELGAFFIRYKGATNE